MRYDLFLTYHVYQIFHSVPFKLDPLQHDIAKSSDSVITGSIYEVPYFELHVCSLEMFLFTTMSRMALRPTHPPIQWVYKGSFPGGKAARA
jgi:hypothetical protein